jgi:hypothetical protein
VRRITADAAADGYRMSSFVRGVIASDAFRMQVAGSGVKASADPEGRPGAR